MPSLTIEIQFIGQHRSQTLSLEQGTKFPGVIRIGRSAADCDVVLRDKKVSRLHAEIFLKANENTFYLRNLTNPNAQTNEGKLMIYYVDRNTGDRQYQVADFIIDATGLEAKPQFQPFLKDLIERYSLSVNPLGRLDVTNEFKVKEMDNRQGRMYAAGVITLGGPYAPVDTFLGLQYSARRAIDDLVGIKNSGVRYLNGFGSFVQWLKWARNQAP